MACSIIAQPNVTIILHFPFFYLFFMDMKRSARFDFGDIYTKNQNNENNKHAGYAND